MNFLYSLEAVGQQKGTDTVETNENVLGDPIEIMPRFPGGEKELSNYIKQTLKRVNIPDSIKGRVFVQFAVEKTGEIKDVIVLRSLYDPCDKEAIRVVSSMPNWSPGTQMGKPISTRMVLPIVF